MKDKWMNLGCEEEELKPYVEPEQDFKEPKRIGTFLDYMYDYQLARSDT